jgi:hypothetical protein
VNARQGSTLKLPYSRPVVPLFFLQCWPWALRPSPCPIQVKVCKIKLFLWQAIESQSRSWIYQIFLTCWYLSVIVYGIMVIPPWELGISFTVHHIFNCGYNLKASISF